MEIIRKQEISLLQERFKDYPAVAILGPRQCGKTTLSKQFSHFIKKEVVFFDCENPQDINRLSDPLTALSITADFIVLDEIQRIPELFPVLRVLVDRNKKTKFLILGSASPDLLKQTSETLAGRIHYIEMSGFLCDHVGAAKSERLWIRGGFPRCFLARSESSSYQWRQDFIANFLERDIPNLGLKLPSRTMRRFWTMLAHYHGQLLNASEIGRSLELSDHTIRRYVDLLSGTFMIRQLMPWHYNTKKRIIKSPKIYFRDSGLLHALLSLETKKDVFYHPKLGLSWEGFALESVIQSLHLSENNVFFWGVHTGAEIDLIFQKKGNLFGIEVKYSQAPSVTSSMRSALDELSLAHLWIIHPGEKTYQLTKKITVIPATRLKSINK